MCRPSTAFLATMLLLVGLIQAQAPSPSELPDGPMQAKATTACTECHEARIIVQQRLSKPAWTKEVDKMVKWGAVVEPQDHDPLVDYLSNSFTVEKAPYVASRSRGAASSSK